MLSEAPVCRCWRAYAGAVSRKIVIDPKALLSDVERGRFIHGVGDIFAVFSPLFHAFGEQVFNLSVHRAKVILRPSGNLIIEFGGKAQRHLLFWGGHLNTDCPNSLRAGHPGCRTEPPEDWRPWRLSVLRPVPPCRPPSAFPTPFPPCPRHRPRSFCGHR